MHLHGSRRDFLSHAGHGFGLLALGELLSAQASAAAPSPRLLNPLAPRAAHFPAKAKSVIWLFMNGGQSHVDTWDYKPAGVRRDVRHVGARAAEGTCIELGRGLLARRVPRNRAECPRSTDRQSRSTGAHVSRRSTAATRSLGEAK